MPWRTFLAVIVGTAIVVGGAYLLIKKKLGF